MWLRMCHMEQRHQPFPNMTPITDETAWKWSHSSKFISQSLITFSLICKQKSVGKADPRASQYVTSPMCVCLCFFRKCGSSSCPVARALACHKLGSKPPWKPTQSAAGVYVSLSGRLWKTNEGNSELSAFLQKRLERDSFSFYNNSSSVWKGDQSLSSRPHSFTAKSKKKPSKPTRHQEDAEGTRLVVESTDNVK